MHTNHKMQEPPGRRHTYADENFTQPETVWMEFVLPKNKSGINYTTSGDSNLNGPPKNDRF